MDHGGNGHAQLAPCNLEILQKSNYLFHSARNCPLTLTGRVCVCFTCVTDVCIRSVCSNILCYSQGLAMESLEANKLLWKSRPKHHKLLGSKVAMMIHNTSPVKYDLSRFLLLYDHFLSKARPSGLRCCSPDQSHQTQLLHGRRRGWKIEKISDGQQPQNMGEYVLSRYASYICVRWLRRME